MSLISQAGSSSCWPGFEQEHRTERLFSRLMQMSRIRSVQLLFKGKRIFAFFAEAEMSKISKTGGPRGNKGIHQKVWGQIWYST